MLNKLRRLLHRDCQAGGRSRHHAEALPLATATLLIEIARADQRLETSELDTIAHLLREEFGLDDRHCSELLTHAERESEQSVSLYPYTRLINDNFDLEGKRRIVEQLWRVALADGHKDDHEEHLIRRIANLIYLPLRDFTAARHRVAQRVKQQ